MSSFPLTILPHDEHYFGITFLLTFVLNMIAFAISYGLQFDKVREILLVATKRAKCIARRPALAFEP